MSTNLEKNMNSRVGCHVWGVDPVSVSFTELYAQAGCGWVRATRPMQMEVVATGKRQYDFKNNGEAAVDLAIKNGMSIMGIIDGRWGNETQVNKLMWCSPIWDHLDDWKHFVSALVNHYKDRVKYWEILNEPPYFWWYPNLGEPWPEQNPPMQRAPIEYYVRLLNASAEAIRSADPEAKIVLGSGFPDGMLLKRIYELGGRNSFDIVSVHYLSSRDPESFGASMNRLRTIMAANGDTSKQLWDTETGPGGAVINNDIKTPQEYEACYNIYRHCFSYEFGLDRYFWFSIINQHKVEAESASPEIKNYPAAMALQTLLHLIGNGSLKTVVHLEKEVHCYVFNGRQGPLSVIWSMAPAQVSVNAAFKAVDSTGNQVTFGPNCDLSTKPFLVTGDLSIAGLTARLTGKRQVVIGYLPNKIPDDTTPTVCSNRLDNALTVENDAGWDALAVLARRQDVALPEQGPGVSLLASSVGAEVAIGHDQSNVYLQIVLHGDHEETFAQGGLAQFVLRDSNPDVVEWQYFYNSSGLNNLFVSPQGSRVIRFEQMQPELYHNGVVAGVPFVSTRTGKNLTMRAVLPWKELGAFKPGRNNPFYMGFAFCRANNNLAVPAGVDPVEWSHNFNEIYICKPLALKRWVTFN